MKKKTKKITETKVCNRCGIEKNVKLFQQKTIERINGIQHWIHPWCRVCLNKVKKDWGINWIGGKNGGNKKAYRSRVSSISYRKISKTGVGKLVTKQVSARKNRRRGVVLQQQSGRKSSINNSKSGNIVKTLRKHKDYVGE